MHQTLEIMVFVLKTSKLCYLVCVFARDPFYWFVHCHFNINMWIIGASFAADFYMWVSSIRG